MYFVFLMKNILIPNPEYVQNVIAKMSAQGPQFFHVVADFDRTLTKAFVDGKPRSSLESILEWAALLWADYSEKSKQHFETYYPIEIDPTIPVAEKKEKMLERRTVQFQNMIDHRLSKQIIEKTMQSEKVVFRWGYEIFFSILHKHQIPLVVFSASGLGYQGISHGLESIHAMTSNVHIISNDFIRDDQGNAIGVKTPIIHSFNKNETIVKDFPFYKNISDRKNIILLGDSPGDTHMADWFAYENIIKIWFLNHDTPENRKIFQKIYDVLLINDADMEYVNELIKNVLAPNRG